MVDEFLCFSAIIGPNQSITYERGPLPREPLIRKPKGNKKAQNPPGTVSPKKEGVHDDEQGEIWSGGEKGKNLTNEEDIESNNEEGDETNVSPHLEPFAKRSKKGKDPIAPLA